MRTVCLVLAVLTMSMPPSAEPAQSAAAKPTILVHLTSGPENPTRAALAFLVARTATEQGHAVSIFLAGEAVQSATRRLTASPDSAPESSASTTT